MKEIREKARELMKGYCRVCKVCDGKACAGEVPGMGGLGTGSSFKNNVNALHDVRLNMRLIHGATEPETATSILGIDLDMPVMAAPIGGVSFNMGGQIEEEEYTQAVVGGCKNKGIVGCTGDGVPPLIHECGNKAIVDNGGHGIPFVKPWEGVELNEKLEKAHETGCPAIGMDIDAAGLITLRKMGRPVSPKTPEELRSVIETVHDWGLKFILKGVMAPDEAALAADLGVDGIVVSNHGGRVLDHCPGTAEVLPGVAEKVKGSLTIFADGGVRDGVDVLKLLALGADCVMVGRPFSIAALGGLTDGVEAYIDILKGQLTQAMVLTGCQTIDDADGGILFRY
ncbi:alpha-hydroxy-acid oxidizing protein [Salidesulfovibrio brasiliensis]|uniref:alpha-hydroxy-acid oxidizing protein n=1 Tax=Salidesulfovibrio brasiliensis TaxID=221711 RepID=UPI0006D22844|nr:alpha-hydroxy-acid oxidizing protein [Salidesulfovibrio brasiliensis]